MFYLPRTSAVYAMAFCPSDTLVISVNMVKLITYTVQ